MPIPALFSNAKGNQTVIEGTGKLDVGEYELQLFDSRYMVKDEPPRKWSGWLKPSCIPITIILVLIVLVVLLPLLEQRGDNLQEALTVHGYHKLYKNCSNPCVFTLVESIPDTMLSGSTNVHGTTFETWQNLIGSAKYSIEIASLHWSLRKTDDSESYSDWRGEHIFQSLFTAGADPAIKIRILRGRDFGPKDTNLNIGRLVEVRTVESDSLTLGHIFGQKYPGILSSSIMIIDNSDFYLGSADFHWRSISQSKELGVAVYNCSCLANDLRKIFELYWNLGDPMFPRSGLPLSRRSWSSSLDTTINIKEPVQLFLNGTWARAFFSSAPANLNPTGRSENLNTVLELINEAQEFLDIATEEYLPMLDPKDNQSRSVYWSDLDTALRRAVVERGLTVRILTGVPKGPNDKMTIGFLRSLESLGLQRQIRVRVLMVPRDLQGLNDEWSYFGSQYFVSDKKLYIGTAKWTGNGLLDDASVGLVLDQSHNETVFDEQPIRAQLSDLFERDWSSEYAKSIGSLSVE